MLALVKTHLGKFEEGKEILNDLLASSEGNGAEERNLRLQVLNDLLIFYKIKGDYKEAFVCAQRICSQAEALLQTGLAMGELDAIKYRVNMANAMLLHNLRNETVTPASLYKKCIEEVKQATSTAYAKVISAGLLNNLGVNSHLKPNAEQTPEVLHKASNYYEESITTFQQLLEPASQNLSIKQKFVAEESIKAELMATLCNHGRLQMLEHKYEAAEKTLASAVTIAEVLYGYEHKKVAICLGIVGKLYSDTNRSIYAEGLFNKSLALLAKNRARDTNDICIIVHDFAAMLRRLGKHKQATEIEAEYLAVPEGTSKNKQREAGGLHLFWLGNTQNFDSM